MADVERFACHDVCIMVKGMVLCMLKVLSEGQLGGEQIHEQIIFLFLCVPGLSGINVSHTPNGYNTSTDIRDDTLSFQEPSSLWKSS